MRIILTAFGSAGDTLPFISSAKALQERGHNVIALINSAYANAADKAGINWQGIGEAWQTSELAATENACKTSMERSLAMLCRVIVPRSYALYHLLDRLIPEFGAELVLGHHTSFSAPWSCKKHDVPFAMGAVAPSSWPSMSDPNMYPGMPDVARYPPVMVRLGNAIGQRVTCNAVDPHVNKVRAKLGLPASKRFLFDEMMNGVANIGLWSPAWRGAAADDQSNTHIVGFPEADEPAESAKLEAPLEAFLDAGEPPVVFTLGTTAVHTAGDFYVDAARACAQLGVRGVLLVGSKERANALKDKPPVAPSGGGDRANLIAVPYADHNALFPRARAVVHHGGIGSTAAALRAGVPTVIVPFAHDQFDNARRCRLHGCSVTVGHRKTDKQLVRQLAKILETDTYTQRAHELQQQITQDAFGAMLERALTRPKH